MIQNSNSSIQRPSIKVGYARVSTDEQNLDLQLAALNEAGCDIIFSDKASGSTAARDGLQQALTHCGEGDVLIVWKLDRLGRSLRSLVEMVDDLRARSAGLRVLAGEGAMIDTTMPHGRMIFGIFAVLAEFERELIRERTRAGMAAARVRGARIGRPSKLSSAQIRQAKRWKASHKFSTKEIAERLGVHVATLYRVLREQD